MARKRRLVEHGSVVYSDAEVDREFLRVLRSDWVYVAIRLAQMLVVYWLLARAIREYDLGPNYLLLPMAVEILLMLWLGWFLSRGLVNCPAFRRTSGSTTHVVVITILMLAVASGLIVYEDGTVDFTRLAPGWRVVGLRVVETGLVWAMVIEAVGLIVATAPEVRRWKQVGGKFVWTPVFDLSLRLAAVFFMVIVGIFLFAFVAEWLIAWLDGSPDRAAWLVYGLLLVIELSGLAIGVKIHSGLAGQQAAGPAPSEA